MEENQTENTPDVDVIEPIFVDLGKQSRKRVKKLLQGRGRLWFEVADVLDEVRTILGEEVEGKTILPVILVYGKKRKRRGRWFGN